MLELGYLNMFVVWLAVTSKRKRRY
jgi:hypothetical protein